MPSSTDNTPSSSSNSTRCTMSCSSSSSWSGWVLVEYGGFSVARPTPPHFNWSWLAGPAESISLSAFVKPECIRNGHRKPMNVDIHSVQWLVVVAGWRGIRDRGSRFESTKLFFVLLGSGDRWKRCWRPLVDGRSSNRRRLINRLERRHAAV